MKWQVLQGHDSSQIPSSSISCDVEGSKSKAQRVGLWKFRCAGRPISVTWMVPVCEEIVQIPASSALRFRASAGQAV